MSNPRATPALLSALARLVAEHGAAAVVEAVASGLDCARDAALDTTANVGRKARDLRTIEGVARDLYALVDRVADAEVALDRCDFSVDAAMCVLAGE